MDIANRFNAGGAIATLRQTRNDMATTDFNEMIDDINTKTSDTESLMGGIQKAGASVVAVGALGKGVYSNFQKLKAKISGNNSKKEGGDDEAEDEGTELDTYQTAPRQPSEIQEAGDSTEADATEAEPSEDVGLFDEGNEADDMGNVNFGDEGLDPIAESAGDTDAPLFGEDTTLRGAGGDVEGEDYTAEDVAGEFGEEGGEVGGEVGQTTISTAQTAGGLLQRTDATTEGVEEGAEEGAEEAVDLGAEATTDAAEAGASGLGDALGSIISSASNAIGNLANTATNVASGIGNVIDSATSAAQGTIDSTTGAVTGAVETGVETGAEIGLEAAGDAGLEAAGAALDATGIGAPIGLILNILGGLALAGTMTAGIVGENNAGSEQTDATAQAQGQLKSATSGAVAGIAGRYAV
jgi:hypothetical protein